MLNAWTTYNTRCLPYRSANHPPEIPPDMVTDETFSVFKLNHLNNFVKALFNTFGAIIVLSTLLIFLPCFTPDYPHGRIFLLDKSVENRVL